MEHDPDTFLTLGQILLRLAIALVLVAATACPHPSISSPPTASPSPWRSR